MKKLAGLLQVALLAIDNVTLVLLMLSFNFVGNGLRDALDPRVRGVE